MKKNKPVGIINTINDIIEQGRINQILQLNTEDSTYNGRTIKINGKETINFGSCSYLGLELDNRLKTAAIEAIQNYGIQYSSSRSYVSCTLYSQLEDLLKQLFGAYCVTSPTTTLGHQAVIPVVVEAGDLIIMDQQVHASVQYAALNMQNKAVEVTIIRHNNIDELEALIIKHSTNKTKIWYMADGIYSMYGDYLPIHQLIALLNKYPCFHLYVDDAHGMSWTGKNGCGYVLGQVELHKKMIVGTSFAKAFGTGGGVFLFSDSELCQKVRNCGGPLIFSGPNQIPVIAASIASAKIHLSSEIYVLQNNLKSKISYCHELLIKYCLPVVSNPETPIKFIGLGLTRVGYNMVKRMLDAGFYCNLAIFPAVPETCTGLRFTITNHHTLNDIEKLVSTLAINFPKALKDEGRTMIDIKRAFKKVIDFDSITSDILPESKSQSLLYKIQHETTIDLIPKKIWNKLLKNGNFDWDWLKFLEQTFKDNNKPEHNWNFHYYIIWEAEKPFLATFFTTTINKDDMLSHGSVSYQIELERLNNPYHLCSQNFMMGSLLTEGQHLYVDRSNENWKDILMLLLDTVWAEQIKQNANSLCFRDFAEDDLDLQEFFMNQGFVKVSLPDNHIVDAVNWENKSDFLSPLKSRDRWYLKDNVLKYESLFDIEIADQFSEEDIDVWYELYKNVKGKSYELNTFDLPKKLFREMAKNPSVEIMQLRLKSDASVNNKVVGVTFNIVTAANNYCGIIIGLDYDYLKTHSVYKQTLFHSIIRGGQLKSDKIFLGFTASEVKRKFGANAIPQVAYFQTQDNYSLSVINSIASNTKEFERNKTIKKGLKKEALHLS